VTNTLAFLQQRQWRRQKSFTMLAAPALITISFKFASLSLTFVALAQGLHNLSEKSDLKFHSLPTSFIPMKKTHPARNTN